MIYGLKINWEGTKPVYTDITLKIEKRLGESSRNSFHKCFGAVAMCQAPCSTWGQCKKKKKKTRKLAHRTWFDLWHMTNKISKKQQSDEKC